MEEYVWLLLLFGLWIFEIIGKALKRGMGEDADGEAQDSSLRDPRVARRQLSREVTESARRAEDALERWEERQPEVVTAAPPPAPPRRRGAPVRRQSALEAIASMLVELPLEEPNVPLVQERVRAPVVADPEESMRRRASEIPRAAESTVPAMVQHEEGGLKRLDHLPVLQRAIVLNEILGPPVSLAQPRDLGSV